jgi:hypothetical protein
MRMLRLCAGWSAEKLSQEYVTAGAGSFRRTTIAKIEADKRQIKPSEVQGVARVFGLTATDLLGPDGPNVFLSYAEQDGSIGKEIAAWLNDHGFQVVSAGPPAADDNEPSPALSHVIDTAQAFVVVLSRSFLSSPRCQQELRLALNRERQLLSTGRASGFVYVMRVTDTTDLDDSDLSSHVPIDLPVGSDRSREVALSKLGGSIISSARVPDVRANPPIHDPAGQDFLDRGEELERVVYALNNASGADFWLVLAPPGLGKSWFLERLRAKAAEPESGGWVSGMLDLRSGGEADGGSHDAMTVVQGLFDTAQLQPSEQWSQPEDYVRGVAQTIIHERRSCLCLLDGAELLPASTVEKVREYLGKVYRPIQDSGARLAFVVASRRDDGWRGITPYPQPSVLRLAGFGSGAIQNALEGLADRMPGVHSPAELRKDAELVQRVTEGVPELVRASLEWIRTQQWLEIERLDKPQTSRDLIEAYVRDRLLSRDSLLPAEDGGPASAKELDALCRALRALAPYRLITLSHMNYHLDNDSSFRDAMKEADWQAPALWQAIANTALLLPLNEPWREMHPAIRRLLYRHFYAESERADAHVLARDFTKGWADGLTGKDQVTGMVESIWHEAVRLQLTEKTTVGDELTSFVRTVSLAVRSPGYTEAELREYAVQRMKNDDELQLEIANIDGLFDKLVRVVRDPEI